MLIHVVFVIFFLSWSNVIHEGTSMWSLPAQHCGFHTGQGASAEESTNDSSTGSTHVWPSPFWSKPKESS